MKYAHILNVFFSDVHSYYYWANIFSIFICGSEEKASDLPGNLEEVYPDTFMTINMEVNNSLQI